MENNELLNEKNRLLDEIGEAHMRLCAVLQVMDLALNDMHDCLKMPAVFVETIRADKHVLSQQRNEIYDVVKRFEEIAPDDCNEELY